MHGGTSRRGDQHPGFRHGRFARYGPAKLRQLIDQVAVDAVSTNPQADVLRFEALIRLRLERARGERRNLDDADEDALARLSAAKLAAWDRELRRLQLSGAFVAKADARAFAAAVSMAVYAHVRDPAVQRAIRDEVAKAMRTRGIGPPPKGDEGGGTTNGKPEQPTTAGAIDPPRAAGGDDD